MSRLSSTGRDAGCRVGRERWTQPPAGLRKTTPSLEHLEPRQLLAAAVTVSPAANDAPTVVEFQRFGFHAQPTVLVLHFSEPLDPARAGNAANYFVSNQKSRVVTITSAVYDPATLTVTLQLRRQVKLHPPGVLIVNGHPPSGLTNTAGVLLDGAKTGRPGTDFSIPLGRGVLAGPASAASPDSTAAVDAALKGLG